MKQVLFETFFDELKRQKVDIMPKIVGCFDKKNGYKSEWINQQNGEVFGVSFSGNGIGQNKTYFLNK